MIPVDQIQQYYSFCSFSFHGEDHWPPWSELMDRSQILQRGSWTKNHDDRFTGRGGLCEKYAKSIRCVRQLFYSFWFYKLDRNTDVNYMLKLMCEMTTFIMSIWISVALGLLKNYTIPLFIGGSKGAPGTPPLWVQNL